MGKKNNRKIVYKSQAVKNFSDVERTLFLQNFRFERMGIISSPIYHHFNLYGPRHDQRIKGKNKLNRRL